jgi:2-polyprenyl-3-methyl-5-hydroxy-6-metoxy-1,4-benzoquinol methylase
MNTIESAIDSLKEKTRTNMNVFTARAFSLIPPVDKPAILDIGCGSGIPTMELARLSSGTVTAIDIDEKELKKLREKVKEAGIEERITHYKHIHPVNGFL